MRDKNGTDIIVSDYLAFPSEEGRDIGQVIEINEDSPTSNVVVLHVATSDVSQGGGVSGILRKIGDALHIHYALTSYVTGHECELVMLGDGSLPVLEKVKAVHIPVPTPTIEGSGADLGEQQNAAVAAAPSPAPTAEAAPEEAGYDANGSPVPAIPVPAG